MNDKIEIHIVCPLCNEETNEKVTYYVGGFVSYAHPSCMKIAENIIGLYERWVLFHYKLRKGFHYKIRKEKHER